MSTPSSSTTRADALRLARRLGCEGAHETDKGWMPCPTPEALLTAVRDGAAGFKKWKKSQGRETPGTGERGIVGINTLPGGGLVSAPIAAKTESFSELVRRHRNVSERRREVERRQQQAAERGRSVDSPFDQSTK